MPPGWKGAAEIPDPVRDILEELHENVGVRVRVRVDGGVHDGELVYASEGAEAPRLLASEVIAQLHDGQHVLEIAEGPGPPPGLVLELVAPIARRAYDFANEIQFFTSELSERYEEINLLYSISETLGSTLELADAARIIMEEVCDVLSARRGSLWIHEPQRDQLHLVASVGEPGSTGPLTVGDSDSVTASVFREQRARIATLWAAEGRPGTDSLLCVPIRYSPPSGESRTVGVVNVLGRKQGGRFTAGDQKLLAAIASQVGAAIENHRLVRESLRQERIQRELELAHHLQMKLLPDGGAFDAARVGARVEPADTVGGDFYHLLKLPDGRVGVMIGDVSGHGFPAALIMTLTMSAAAIYAGEFTSPALVLGHLDEALREELQNTEMYLTLFYAVVDPRAGTLTYANAGHPHAFAVRCDGSSARLGAMDTPLGLAEEDEYAECSVPWSGDDVLLLFTDGLYQALGGTGGEGEAKVVEEVVRMRTADPADIVRALFELEVDGGLDFSPDDRTAIVLRV